MFQLTFWSLPAFLAVAISTISLVRLKSSPHLPGVVAMRWLFVGIIIWAAAQLTGSLTTGLTAKVWAAKLQYPGIVITPVAWFIFAVTYARRLSKTPHGLLVCLLIVPVLTLVIVLTNELHGFMWLNQSVESYEGFKVLVVEHSEWFTFHTYYSYGVVFAATVILAFALSQSRSHARPLLATIAAPATVMIFNFSYVAGWTANPWFDMTPLALAIATVILDTGVIRYGLLDTIPVIRHRIVERLQDAVIIIGRNGRIIDANPSALQLLDLDLNRAITNSVDEIVGNKTLVELMLGRLETAVVTLKERSYDVVITRAEDGEEIIVVARDITERQQAQQALNTAKQELERLANTDPLTGLYNRRVFLTRLAEEAERVKRHNNELSVLIFDLDHFKLINDRYGHDVGDTVLKEVSSVAQGVKRLTDVSARIGGEEFAMLLPETDQAGAVKLAQRLRRSIEAIRIADSNGAPIKVTASVGVATVKKAPDDLDAILRFADRALYRAKNSGRNMVCIDEG